MIDVAGRIAKYTLLWEVYANLQTDIVSTTIGILITDKMAAVYQSMTDDEKAHVAGIAQRVQGR